MTSPKAEIRTAQPSSPEVTTRALTRALGELGHEVGTPLGSILMMSEMLAEDPAVPFSEPQRTMVRNFGAAAHEVRTTVHGLVRLVRLRTGHTALRMDAVRAEPLAARFADLGLTTTLDRDLGEAMIVTDSRRLVEMVEVLLPFLAAPSRLRVIWDSDSDRGASDSRDSGSGSSGSGSSGSGSSDPKRVGLIFEAELPNPVPSEGSAVLDPLATGDLKVARRFGGSGLELPIASALAWRLGGKARWVERGGGSAWLVELPAEGRDPLEMADVTSQ